MANAPAVNTPSADLIKSFIERALKHAAAQHPILTPLHPALIAAVAGIVQSIGVNEQATPYEAARLVARGGDEVFDETNRFAVMLLEAFQHHPDEGMRAAAAYLLSLLYPDRLAIVMAAWEIEAASANTFSKRLEAAPTQAHVATLATEVPKIGAHLQRVVTTAQALGQALEALDAFEVDDAGRPLNPKLFEARVQAHKLFASFAEMVETFAYPDDSPDHAKARTALLGPYRRFQGSVTREPKVETKLEVVTPVPTPAPTPTT